MEKVLIILGITISIMQMSYANNINNDIHPLEKKGKFISFNNEEGEVKLELDFAIPFMKIPIHNRKLGEIEKPTLNVNTKSLITVGAMLFLFVTVVPKIVQLFIPQAHLTATESLVPLMARVEEALQSMDISTSECYQRAACWVAGKTLKFPFPNSKSSEWIGSMLESDALQEAFNKGMNGDDCWDYNCPLSMNTIAHMFQTGRQFFV